MNLLEENDSLDALLREQNNYVEDNGFTARVVKSLPRRRVWFRPLILLSATIIGSVLAIFWLPWKKLMTFDSSALLSFHFQTLLPWLVVLSVLASLIWGVIAAIQWED